MKKYILRLTAYILVATLLCCIAGCGDTEDESVTNTAYTEAAYGFQLEMPAAGETVAVMHTNMGDVSLRFFPEAAPKAVENFLTHAENGYYNGLTFHRVINDFMIQGGDPTATGTAGESIWGEDFEDEFDKKLMNLRGSVAMANSGVNTNGSQFFINQAGPTGQTAEELKAIYESQNEQIQSQAAQVYASYKSNYGTQFTAIYPTLDDFVEANLTPDARLVPDEVWELYAKTGGNIHLDGAFRHVGGHTVFAQVYAGMDVVDAIADVAVDSDDKPTTDVVINSIEVTTYQG